MSPGHCRVPAPVCKHTFAHTRRYDLHGSPTFYAAAGCVLSSFSTSVRHGPDLWGHIAKFCALWAKMLAKRFFLKIKSARTLLRGTRGMFIGIVFLLRWRAPHVTMGQYIRSKAKSLFSQRTYILRWFNFFVHQFFFKSINQIKNYEN